MTWFRRHTTKGQHLIIEEVLFVAIGLGIMIAFFTTFQTFTTETGKTAAEDQLTSVATFLRAKVVQASNVNGDGRIFATVPPKIGNTEYIIELDNDGLTVQNSGGITHAIRVHGLETAYKLDGRAQSDTGRVYFQKSGRNITVRPASGGGAA